MDCFITMMAFSIITRESSLGVPAISQIVKGKRLHIEPSFKSLLTEFDTSSAKRIEHSVLALVRLMNSFRLCLLVHSL